MRDPMLYPNWVWVGGALCLIVAVTWLIILGVAYRRSNKNNVVLVEPLSKQYLARYRTQMVGLHQQWQEGRIGIDQVHLGLAAITRAAASERLGVNIENLTVQQVQDRYPDWTALVGALLWCQEPSFSAAPGSDDQAVANAGFQMVAQVVGL